MPRTAPAPNMIAIPGMNPGIIVAGGGGGAGGSGKGGKGGKGGDGGADGSDGENNGEEAENGSGTCGEGGSGSCQNCASSQSAGDPVDVLSGKAFTIPKTDLFLPGAFNLDIRRSYASTRSHVDAGLGFGWTHSLAWSLEEKHHSTIIRTGDGRRVEMARLEVGEMVQNGAWGLIRHKDFYLLRPGNEFMHYFGRTENPKVYRLEFVRYRERGYLSLQYENGQLARVIDSVGRIILLQRGADGRIESLNVPDPEGTSLIFARYAYDSEGNLVAVADADGHMTRFAYDERHLLTRLEYPSGLTFHFRYDSSKRCVETWGAYPNGVDPALAPDVTQRLKDGTPAKGIFHCKLDFAPDGSYSEVIDSIRLRRFFLGPNGHIAKAVDPLGGVTTRDFDDLGRIISLTDPTGATWQYTYDDLDEVVRETDPEGNVVEIQRDGGGRTLGVRDAEGGHVEVARGPSGEEASIRLQNGAIQHYQVGFYGRMTERLDERGGRHHYEWDSHGNLIAYVSPTGGRSTFTYDYWGRRLSGTDPLGNTIRLDYLPSGLVSVREDALGRRTHYYYDAMGNLAQQVGPDGSVQSWQYGGLNWLYSAIGPDRSEVRTWFNREGWPVLLENEAGERHEFEYDASGLVIREKDFLGVETRIGYDARGRVIWYDEGEGKFEIERNLIGHVVKRTAPDGSSAEYRYNRRGELVSAARDGIGFQWERDPIGAIVAEELAAEGATYTVENEREPGGERQRTHTSLGYEARFQRNLEGQVVEVRADGGTLLVLERDAVGQAQRRKLWGGAAIQDSYDALYRLRGREILPPPPGTMRSDLWDQSPRERYRQMLDYSAADELIAVSDSDGEKTLLEYDQRRRLKRRERKALVEEFRADVRDNYFEVTPDIPRAYGAGSQLTRRGDYQYRYDRRGRLLEKTLLDGLGEPIETTRFEWNAWGLLSAVALPGEKRVEFQYDPFARRIGKTVSENGAVTERHHYVWDLVAMLHDVELTADGQPKNTRTYSYLDPETGVPFAQRDDATGSPELRSWAYYFADVKGQPEKIVDGTGLVLTTYEHTALGKATAQFNPAVPTEVLTPFRAPGQQEDPETGLFYNRYRYYDPDLGRFISPDPIGLEGGLNTYSYGPNPIGWVDPMGWKHTCIVLGSDGTNATLLSGYHDLDDDHSMRNQPRAHTEQKFMHELMSREGAMGGGLKGETFNLLGEMPPCPRCHAAMMRGAKETGADVNYKWKDKDGNVQTISYKGGTGEPTATGDKAEKLLNAYPTKLTNKHADGSKWQFHPDEDPSARSANDYWGVEPKEGAEKAYFDMASGKSKNQDVWDPGEDDYWSQDEIDANQPGQPPKKKQKTKKK